jgi:hypothetical protein
MAEKDVERRVMLVNRAPVLTIWAAVVAEALGFEHDEALTLGRAVAGVNAYLKGVSLGLFKPFIMGNWGPLIFSHLSPFFRGSWEAGIIGSGGRDG